MQKQIHYAAQNIGPLACTPSLGPIWVPPASFSYLRERDLESDIRAGSQGGTFKAPLLPHFQVWHM